MLGNECIACVENVWHETVVHHWGAYRRMQPFICARTTWFPHAEAQFRTGPHPIAIDGKCSETTWRCGSEDEPKEASLDAQRIDRT